MNWILATKSKQQQHFESSDIGYDYENNLFATKNSVLVNNNNLSGMYISLKSLYSHEWAVSEHGIAV